MKNFDSSLRDFSLAIQLEPDNAEAYFYRGIIRGEKSDFDESFQDLQKVISIQPNNAEAYYSLGVLFDRKGDPEISFIYYTKAIKINADLTSAYYNRALIFWEEKKNYDAALADFQKYLSLDGGKFHNNQAEVEDFIRDLKKKIQ